MAIRTNMSGREVDRVLKAINDAENADNNGKVICIRNGEFSFEDGEEYFDVAVLS